MDLQTALAKAAQEGLDLVEISPTSRPPVVKLIDYGKFKFEQAKAAKLAKKNQKVVETKEMKFRPNIGDHDLETKSRQIHKFLSEGKKVKLVVTFSGREITHSEIGYDILTTIINAVEDIGKVEVAPSLEGKFLTSILTFK